MSPIALASSRPVRAALHPLPAPVADRRPPPPRRRRAPRHLVAAWTLLFLQTYDLSSPDSPLALPGRLGQLAILAVLGVLVAQSAVTNYRWEFRPVPVLFAYGAIAVCGLVPFLYGVAGLGTVAHALRLLLVVVVCLLLSRHATDPLTSFGMVHLRALTVVCGLVAAGALLLPGAAFGEAPYRLRGLLPVMTGTQVGQASAALVGLAVLAGVGRSIRRGRASVLVAAGVVLLVLSKTRTAAVALALGLVLALASLMARNRTARRVLIGVVAAAAAAVMAFGAAITTWFQRGQTSAQLSDVSGRKHTWELVLGLQRDAVTSLFGVGLRDGKYDGHPIDSGFVTAYYEQGYVGLGLLLVLLVGLAIGVGTMQHGVERAMALFLLVDVLVSSYTETGVANAEPYMLHVVAAAFLVHADHRRRRVRATVT